MYTDCHLEIVSRGGETIVLYKKGATKRLDIKNNTTIKGGPE